LKPLLPRCLRLAGRRVFAKWIRLANTDTWPIDEASAKAPADWLGWPENKKFAFVITHDVEGAVGIAKCQRLAEIEMELGFRSSFNFIPEGGHEVPASLRRWLIEHGFEVGVHDLHHDGKLYRNREAFRKSANTINRYIAEWGAVGYRSGFMLHNYDWHHDLNIAYDASSFDTDPFEPQPDGVRTIFPFWIPLSKDTDLGFKADASKAQRTGYVELPYSLPQDSTLFFVLKEKTPEIWLRKLDWVARHGGMALVNVHPDYIQLPGEAARHQTYPVDHYTQLLRHIRDTYTNTYWHKLPREVATLTYKPLAKPAFTQKPRHIGMVSHSFYESDNRVIRYAEALASRGDKVDVFALNAKQGQPEEEIINGVRLFRIQGRSGKNERTKLAFLLPLLRFLFRAAWSIAKHHRRQKYDCLHIHNIPDFMVFSGLYPKLTGTPILLDIHDIVPEFFASKFGKPTQGALFTSLLWMERISAALANHVIIANDLWRGKYAARTGTEKRCTVFINNVDTRIFKLYPRTRTDDRLIVLFPGGLQWHQGVDIAIRAFAQVVHALPRAEFHIYGAGNTRETLIALTAELGLQKNVLFFEPTSIEKIAPIIAQADLGVVPKRADSFGNEAYSTKIMEFMAVGVPMIIANTKVDRFYFNDDVVRFFESGNVDSLAQAIIDLLSNPALRQRYIAQATEYVRKNCWETRKNEYLALVDSLCNPTK